ncbi:STAS domain-containing protein [Streptomyces sp. NPDC048255]|uniref:STAS domain-containing protein n=1 Tax=Streptomyces TaxID=1883 RepID=UPI0033EAC6C1
MNGGPSYFRVSVVDSEDRTTVVVGGELDVYCYQRLRTVLEAAITGGAHRVEVDLRDLSFSDISGFDILLRAREQALQAGCGFEIVGPLQPRILRLFKWMARDMGPPVSPRANPSSPNDADGGSCQLRVSLVDSRDRTTVVVGGELDGLTGAPLRAVLRGAITRGADRVEVDLRDLSFCDFSGLRVLLWARERALQAGCGFELVGPIQRPVFRLLQLMAPVMGLPVRPAADRSPPNDADPPHSP